MKITKYNGKGCYAQTKTLHHVKVPYYMLVLEKKIQVKGLKSTIKSSPIERDKNEVEWYRAITDNQ